MHNSLATALSMRILLLLTALWLSAPAVLAATPAPELVARQTTTTGGAGQPLTQDQACQQYSRLANFSVIGTNSSYRTAFLEASPVGTLANAAMLNQIMLALPALTADAALNDACGNLTTVAVTEAANNFSRGVVAQFSFTGNPSAVVNGYPTLISVGLALLIICGPLSAL